MAAGDQGRHVECLPHPRPAAPDAAASPEDPGVPVERGHAHQGRGNQTTIRNIIASELYAPHTFDEVTELVEPAVAARLAGEALYGLWTWNTRKTTRREVWDEGAGKFKIRYNYSPRPREEWLFVPVPDAGISRAVVEAARQSLEDNARKPSGAAERFWELSGGILRCGECGHTLRPHTTRTRVGRPPSASWRPRGPGATRSNA